MSSASPSEVTEGLLQAFGHGTGYPELKLLPNPAPGANLSYKVSGFYWERIAALTVELTTSNHAANRSLVLEVLDQDGGVLAAIPPAAVQTATQVRTYTFLPNMNTLLGPVGGVFFAPVPLFFLQPTWTIVTAVANIDANDQIGPVRLYRERFSTGPDGYPIGRTPVQPFRVPVVETPPSS